MYACKYTRLAREMPTNQPSLNSLRVSNFFKKKQKEKIAQSLLKFSYKTKALKFH